MRLELAVQPQTVVPGPALAGRDGAWVCWPEPSTLARVLVLGALLVVVACPAPQEAKTLLVRVNDQSLELNKVAEARRFEIDLFEGDGLRIEIENPTAVARTVILKDGDTEVLVFRLPAQESRLWFSEVPRSPYRLDAFVDGSESVGFSIETTWIGKRDAGQPDPFDAGAYAQCVLQSIRLNVDGDMGTIPLGGFGSRTFRVQLGYEPSDGSLPITLESCQISYSISNSYGFSVDGIGNSGSVTFRPVPYEYGQMSIATVTVTGPTNSLSTQVRARTEPVCPAAMGVPDVCERSLASQIVMSESELYEADDGGLRPLLSLVTPIGRPLGANDVAVSNEGRLFVVLRNAVCEVGATNGVVRNCLNSQSALNSATAIPDGGIAVGGAGLYIFSRTQLAETLLPEGTVLLSGDVAYSEGALYFTTLGLTGDQLHRFDLQRRRDELVAELAFSGAQGLRIENGVGFAYTNTGFEVQIDLRDGGTLGQRQFGTAWFGAANRPGP